jgi:Di-haem oxidoreductase, putative peroxidase
MRDRSAGFSGQLQAGNLSFRIPLQMLGLGLIDSIQDREILRRFNATADQRSGLGIAGHPNRSGNDGTITRFGWKAQNKSITMFAAEAYNVEMGITNELFPTATEEDPKLDFGQFSLLGNGALQVFLMPAGIFARSRARPGPTKNSVYPYILGHFAHPPLRKLAKVKLSVTVVASLRRTT